jgi:FSR family fosmidomycin resistance protein-like MFS transporter
LLLIGVADELQAGIPVIGAPQLGHDLDVGQGVRLLGTVLALPMALALLLEPWVHAWSDHCNRRGLLRGSLVGAAVFLAAAALAPNALTLSCCLGAWGLSTGIACGLAQSGLVAESDQPTRALTRWAIATSVGDILAPAFVVALGALGWGWRWALAGGALVSVLCLVATGRTRIATEPPPEDDGPTVWMALGTALRNRPLLGWLIAIASCTLLDEIVLILGALRLQDDPAATGLQLGALVVGDGVGLAFAEWRLRRTSPRTVLLISAAAAGGALTVWLSTDHRLGGAAAMLVLGAAAALHWPLAKGAAFACLPGRPGIVNALDSATNAVDVVAPLALGAVVSAFGVHAALALLLLQPLTVGAAALWLPMPSDSGRPQRRRHEDEGGGPEEDQPPRQADRGAEADGDTA